MKKLLANARYKNVWDAISDTPEEAAHMKARSELMIAVTQFILREQLTQAQAAKLLGVTQPRVSDLMRGKIDLFSIDTLIELLHAAGLQVEMKLRKMA
mgnify:CR=1 FL=1